MSLSMNSSALGDEGVAAVRSFFNRLGYIKPYINSDDTQPIWDGNLFVYNDRKDFANDRFKFSVPIQVKAHEHQEETFPDKTNFDVEIVNLRNYYNDGGVVFFDVLVGPERNQIYVNFLTKSVIKNLLDTAKGNTTRRISCSKIPKTYTQIISQLRTLHLQRTHALIPFEEVKKYKNVQWAIDSYGIEDNTNPFEYITSNPVNILAYVDGLDKPLYVGNSAATISTVRYTEQHPVRIGERKYFESYEQIVEGSNHTLVLGKSLTLKFGMGTSSRIEVSIELGGDTIEEIVYELEFILALFKEKKVTCGSNSIILNMPVEKATITLFQDKLKFWSDVKDLFGLLHIEEPLLDPHNLTKKDIGRIHTLIAGLLYGKTVVGKNDINADHLEWISFSNIRVLVFTRYLGDNKYKITNIFDNLSACYKDTDGLYKTGTIYSKVIAEDVLASNVDWSNLVKSYQETIKVNPDFYERANWDVLWLIKTFDKCQRSTVLNAAKDLLLWIMETDSTTSWHTVWKYTLLQIKLRQGKTLSTEDKLWLIDEEENVPSNSELSEVQKLYSLFSIHVLSWNNLKAKRCYEKMSKDEKDFIEALPIFNLYTKLTT